MSNEKPAIYQYIIHDDKLPKVVVISDSCSGGRVRDQMLEVLQDTGNRMDVDLQGKIIVLCDGDNGCEGVLYEYGQVRFYDLAPYKGTRNVDLACQAARDIHYARRNLFVAARMKGKKVLLYEKGMAVRFSSCGHFYSAYTHFFDQHPQFGHLENDYTSVPYEPPENIPLHLAGWGLHHETLHTLYVLRDQNTGRVYLCDQDCGEDIEILQYRAMYPTEQDYNNALINNAAEVGARYDNRPQYSVDF